jgi:hypothetical protein
MYMGHMQRHFAHSALIALLLVLFIGNAGAENPLEVCGNVNQSTDGALTLSDITTLIDHVYISREPLPNPRVGNINGSPDMLITLSDITMLIDAVYISRSAVTCTHVEAIQSGCLGQYSVPSTLAEPGPDSVESMHVEAIDGDLVIHHINAWYQCCPIYAVEYEIEDNHITVQELDLFWPEGCKCMCYFNFEATISFLADGEYVVTLIHWDGDTVGVDTAVIGDTQIGIIDFTNSDCLGSLSTSLSEDIEYLYQDGILTMSHHNAIHNCALDLQMEFEMAGDTLRFYEINVETDLLRCECPFDISADVAGVQPGEYLIEVYQQERDYPPELVDSRVVQLGL